LLQTACAASGSWAWQLVELNSQHIAVCPFARALWGRLVRLLKAYNQIDPVNFEVLSWFSRYKWQAEQMRAVKAGASHRLFA